MGKSEDAMSRIEAAVELAKVRHQRNQVRHAEELATAVDAGWTAQHDARVDGIVASIDEISPEPPGNPSSPGEPPAT